MTRFQEGIIVRLGKGIKLTENEIFRLEIKLIGLERLLETDRLDYDKERNLVVRYESMLESMDQ